MSLKILSEDRNIFGIFAYPLKYLHFKLHQSLESIIAHITVCNIAIFPLSCSLGIKAVFASPEQFTERKMLRCGLSLATAVLWPGLDHLGTTLLCIAFVTHAVPFVEIYQHDLQKLQTDFRYLFFQRCALHFKEGTENSLKSSDKFDICKKMLGGHNLHVLPAPAWVNMFQRITERTAPCTFGLLIWQSQLFFFRHCVRASVLRHLGPDHFPIPIRSSAPRMLRHLITIGWHPWNRVDLDA